MITQCFSTPPQRTVLSHLVWKRRTFSWNERSFHFFFFFFDRGCKIDGFPSRGPINFPPNEFDSTSRMSQIYSCKINRPSFVRASIFHACFEIWPGIEAIFFFFRCFSDRCFNREHCTLVKIIFHPMKTWMKYACIYLILFILSVCIYLFASTNLKRAIRKIGSD